MFVSNTFGRTVDLLQRNLDVTSMRHEVIADNIANAETPNFKRSELNYETRLHKAIESQRHQGLEAKTTHEKHMPFHRPVDYRSVKPKLGLDYLTQSKNNGNNVDVEVETMNLLQNQLKYQMMTRSINHQFSQVNLVLR